MNLRKWSSDYAVWRYGLIWICTSYKYSNNRNPVKSLHNISVKICHRLHFKDCQSIHAFTSYQCLKKSAFLNFCTNILFVVKIIHPQNTFGKIPLSTDLSLPPQNEQLRPYWASYAWVALICQFASVPYSFVNNSKDNDFSAWRQLFNEL
jgi:hypothetical protein